METKIMRTLREWMPALMTGKDGLDDYGALRMVASFFLDKIRGSNDERQEAVEALKVVNLIYISGPLHDRNAIENEFLCTLAAEDAPGSLKRHIDLFPRELRQAYLKTILEN